MNSDISGMIELQRFWDTVLRCRDEIKKAGDSIKYWKGQIDESAGSVETLRESIRISKSSQRGREVELAVVEEKIARLESRRDTLRTEREADALQNELAAATSEKSVLEEEILLLMDELESKNTILAKVEREAEEIGRQSESDIAMLEERIRRFTAQMDEHQARFEEGLSGLSASVRPKFVKLTGTANGKAIVRIDGEICEGCRVKVPFHLAGEVSKRDRVISCSNCGRFLYSG